MQHGHEKLKLSPGSFYEIRTRSTSYYLSTYSGLVYCRKVGAVYVCALKIIVMTQAIIGSADLKANQSINQVIEIVQTPEKYTRFLIVL